MRQGYDKLLEVGIINIRKQKEGDELYLSEKFEEDIQHAVSVLKVFYLGYSDDQMDVMLFAQLLRTAFGYGKYPIPEKNIRGCMSFLYDEFLEEIKSFWED